MLKNLSTEAPIFMVEIIPKPAPKRPLWLEILFYLGITLIIIVIGAYFGLNYLYKKDTQNIKSLEEQISKVKTPKESALKQKLTEKKTKINDFSALLDGHRIDSNVFSFLGSICHPRVRFLSLNFSKSGEDFKIEIPGEAESYETLHQQLLILKAEKLIKEMKLSGISIGKEGKINFGLSLTLGPEIFKFK
ncbi:MAG: hypothetical protein COV63_02195 [Candidatus Nealsonbacteria bacterium CG11_big_fil_rev_8_21_14_0_20_37_68]|nr:MAG: hypothetical protein COV63_02195 [Candidatus Nealsonbacteria bacterium CG11_big_fil_rev_8_21_14_0_20_37_68]